MLSISKPLSAGQVQTYHKQEFTAIGQNYYKQGGAVEGEWQGHLAKEFGLAGPIDARHFALLTEGKNPQTEEQIIRSKASAKYTKANGTTVKPVEHRAGWDATLSAPKSVSLAALVGGDERVREAHREAVTAALTELERYTQARIGGNHPAETTGRFIAAKFEHDTARPVDGYAAPQLHTHAVVFNMTQRDNGKMRALQSKSFYDSKSYLTAFYQSELTSQLRNLGYEITAGKSGAPEIKGFSQEYLDASSLRSQKIREQMKKNGFEGPAAAQIAALETRDSKQLLSPEEVLAAHRQIAAEHGNQAQKIVSAARERSQQAGQVPRQAAEREARARVAVAYARDHLFEREAVADRRDILRDALRRGMGETTPAEIRAEFERRRELGEFQQAGIRSHDTERRYTTPEMLAAELANIAMVRTWQNTMEPTLTAQQAESQAASKSFLNPTQRAAIQEVLTSRDRILGLQGLAGTGKTTTLDSIRQGAERAGYTVEGFAPTGKAAGQLREAGIQAGTLQRFLARGDQGPADPNDRHFYMLDEASLASTRLMRDFLRKLGPNDRALIIGDTGQHQGVDAGRPFEQMQQAGMKTAQLSEIMRQKDTELRRAVEHLAKGETAEGVKLLREQGRITEITSAQERIAAIAKDYMVKPESTIIVSPDNASRRDLNQAVRAALLEDGKIKNDGIEFQTLVPRGDLTGADRAWAARYSEGDVVRYAKGSTALGIERGSYAVVSAVDSANNELTVRRGDGQAITYDPTRLRGVSVYREQGREFATGDRIQFTAPDKKLAVANRDLATVTEVQADRLTLKLEGAEGRSIIIDPSQMRHIDHAYAVTSHISQGLTVDRVLINLDSAMNKMLINARLAYVAVSRAAHDVRIYVSHAEGLEKQLASQVTKSAALELGIPSQTAAVGPKQQTVAPAKADPAVAMRDAARMLGTKEASIGINMLEHQGRMTVEPNRAARLSRMVQDYAGRRQGTVAVTRTPSERDELNRLIRAELQRSRTISPDSRELPVLIERAIAATTAAAYRPGDVIEFRAGSRQRGIEPNSSARVLAVNPERNRLTIQTRDGEVKTYNPAKLNITKQSKVYAEQTRDIAVGERIRITAAYKPDGIRAGDFATIESIRGIGALQVRTETGKVLELNPALAQHIEYGYAADSSTPIRAERLLVDVESPAQLEKNSPTLKAILASKDTRFYTSERTLLREAITPEEISKLLARTATKQEKEQARQYAPLHNALGRDEAKSFRWVAETGPIYTYQSHKTGRNIHIDQRTGQFVDQQRQPISGNQALTHALSSSDDMQPSNGSQVRPQIIHPDEPAQEIGLSS